jgi:hypothetical protein
MTETPKLKPLEMSLNFIWMLQPDYNGLRQSLDNMGYTRKESLRGSLIMIAKKGTVEIFINPERRVLGIESETSTKDILTAAEDLEKAYLEIGMEPKNLLFVEFIGNFIFPSLESPLKKMNSIKMENDLLSKIGVALEKDVVNMGLNITTKESNPTESEWLGLNIEPLYSSANKNYIIRAIFRGAKEKVFDFVKHVEKRLPKVIEKIEGS